MSDGHDELEGIERFTYGEPLDEHHIRIIELLPGNEDDVIRCNLTTELRQDTEDSYDAISYAWGDSNETVDIICNDKVLSITTSLAGALRTIRKPNPRFLLHSSTNTAHTSQQRDSSPWRRLWADAICIQQKSNEEKNHQVKRMGQVYASARQVLSWLGPDGESIARDCFRLIKLWNMQLHGNDMPVLDEPAEGNKITQLIRLSYFSRVWVLQEVALSKKCLLLWGNQIMNIAELIEFSGLYTASHQWRRQINIDFRRLDLLFFTFRFIHCTYGNSSSWKCSRLTLRRHYEISMEKGGGLFLDVLQVGGLYSATNPRDHIYAFLGNPLAYTREKKMMVEPNYGKNPSDVFYHLACALLESKRESPFILCFVQHRSEEDISCSGKPSWVPQWNIVITESLSWTPTIGNLGGWSLAGGSVERLHYQVRERAEKEKYLFLKGIKFDGIIWTSEALKQSYFTTDQGEWGAKLKNLSRAYIATLWESSLHALKRHHDCEDLRAISKTRDNFSLTLTAEHYPSGAKQNLSEHREDFRIYLQTLDEVYRNEKLKTFKAQTEANPITYNDYYYEHELRNCDNRKLAVTENGQFALVPQFAQPGDMCCILLGMATPFILRPAKAQNTDGEKLYHLVGECYIRGVMSGELVEALDRGEVEQEEIILV